MDQVTVDYPARPGIIRDVSLNLPAGSFTFVTGPSGAGKTTLLKLMFLGLKPSAGRLQIFGRNAYDLSRDQKAYVRSRLGVVFQDFRLIDHMSIYDNVALPLRVTGKDVKSERDYVQELLYWVGLGDYANAKPEELSGGQKQRVAIAGALVEDPYVLLLDELTTFLDEADQAGVVRAVRNVVDQTGATAVWVNGLSMLNVRSEGGLGKTLKETSIIIP